MSYIHFIATGTKGSLRTMVAITSKIVISRAYTLLKTSQSFLLYMSVVLCLVAYFSTDENKFIVLSYKKQVFRQYTLAKIAREYFIYNLSNQKRSFRFMTFYW